MEDLTNDHLRDVILAVQGIYARKDPAHDLQHALRVREWGRLIALQEGADSLIVELSAILHDIGRSGTVEKTHAESSAALAVSILQKCRYPASVIEKVKECIITHSREGGYEPQSLEAKILYDADKLDFVGPVGIARLFSWGGAQGLSFFGRNSCEEFYRQRICHYQEHINTKSAKMYFEPLFSYMENFWDRLESARLK